MGDDPEDIRHARAVRTLLDLVEGSPEERREKQHTVLARVRATYLRDYGYLPEWWIELREEVEDGKL